MSIAGLCDWTITIEGPWDGMDEDRADAMLTALAPYKAVVSYAEKEVGITLTIPAATPAVALDTATTLFKAWFPDTTAM